MASLVERGGRYTIRYRDVSGRERWKATGIRATANGRREALRVARDLEDQVARARLGLVDKSLEYAALPIEHHVADFELHMRSRGRSPGHRAQVSMRLGRMLRGLGAKRVGDITAEAVERLLIELRESGIPDRCLTKEELESEPEFRRRRRGRVKSAKTRDDYLDSLRFFCRWADEHGRMPSNPIRSVKQLRSKSRSGVDVTFTRRAMTREELGRLVSAARERGVANKLKAAPSTAPQVLEELRLRGEARALAYTLASTLGVRQAALCAIRWEDLDLRSGVLRLRAEHAKNGREIRPDMPVWLVEEFQKFRERLAKCAGGVPSSAERVFALLPVPKNLKRLMDKDLEFAGVPLETHEGRVDFHALRTMAATQLFEVGVEPRDVAELLNADERVIRDRYTRYREGRGRAAVDRLPAPEVLPVEAVSGSRVLLAAGG